jgi:hypothetical protein
VGNTVTIRLPSPAVVARLALAALAAVAVVAAGVFVGTRLTSPDEVQTFAQGAPLQEIRLADGTVVVGRVSAVGSAYLRLSGAADVTSGTGEQAGATVVRMITAEPVDASGAMLISRDQVVSIMNVASGSELETAYRQASGQLEKPTSTPAGSAGATP